MTKTIAILAMLAMTGCTTVVEWRRVDDKTERITANARVYRGMEHSERGRDYPED